MTEEEKTPRRGMRWASAAGLLAAGALTGGVLAGTMTANAATDTTAPSSSSSSTTHTRDNYPAHGTAAHEALEKPVTGTNAAKAKALRSRPSAAAPPGR